MKIIEIPILSHIGNDTSPNGLGRGFMAEDISNAIVNQEYDAVKFTIASPGGSVFEGEKMSNLVNAIKGEGKIVIMEPISRVGSVATVFMLNASPGYLIAHPDAKFMIHKAHYGEVKISGNADQIEMMAQVLAGNLRNQDSAIINEYKTKRPLKNTEELFNTYYVEERWMTAQQALDFGLIDSIKADVKNFFLPFEANPGSVPPATTIKGVYKDYLEKSAGYKRLELPQISWEQLDTFLAYFSAVYGEDILSYGKRKLSDLMPAQNEFDEQKIADKKDYEGWKYRTFIISGNDYLLDGHHDWAAGLEENPDEMVDTIQIDLSIKKLVKEANALMITRSEPV